VGESQNSQSEEASRKVISAEDARLTLPVGTPIVGRGRDKLISYVDDDEHLKDFAEYMT
jgi:hypothetical protein